MAKAIYLILGTVLLLLSLGVVMLYSTSGIFAEQQYADALFFVKRQLMWIGVGTLLMMFGGYFHYLHYRTLSNYLLMTAGVMLLAVFVPGIGKTVGGGRRWIELGFFAFQPSEAAKLVLVLFFADYLARLKEDKERGPVRGFLLPFGILGVFLGLIFVEPDFGMTMLTGAVVMAMFFVGGINLKYLIGCALASLPLVYLAVFSSEYRRKRILAFLNPWDDPRGIGFQIIQSFVALGTGGLFGVGLGQSQQKLFFLPEAHTDFIFSIIGEELGFAGCAGVLALFLILVGTCAYVAVKIRDDYGRLVVVGVLSMIGLQAAINIGVVAGALPTKGLPLPFISFGGSNLVVNMLALGIVLNIARTNLDEVKREKIFRDKSTKHIRF